MFNFAKQMALILWRICNMRSASHIKKAGSAILLIVFLFGVVPPEYLHDIFANHHDGVDPILKKGQTVFLPKHTHCSYLGFEYAPFTVPEQPFLIFEHTEHHTLWVACSYAFICSLRPSTLSLRGPPALVV
ncbi:MAG: hypothetical protein EBZ77_00960 [Chitinophagia bacterium]|nr:hypothetical protein [Chitinophagia bacterium]